MSDYQLRSDIDKLFELYNAIDSILKDSGVTSLGEFLNRYYDRSDMDVVYEKFETDLTKLDDDLTRFDDELTGFDNDLTVFDGRLNTLDTDLNKLNSDVTVFNGRLNKFNTDLTKLNGDLTVFDGRLNTFNNDLTGFDNDLTEFDGRLNNLDSDLNKLDSGLTTLNSSFDDLALDLYGDANTEGFVDYLNQLQVILYGKGQTYKDKNNVTHNCSINDPCPSSLKGLLNSLQTDNTQLKEDNNNLKYTLNVLTMYLTNFTGTLNEFKSELRSHGINYSNLDTGIAQLLEAIFKTQTAIDTVDARVDTVNDNIDSVNGRIDDTNTAVNVVDAKAVDVRKKLYSGTNDTGTINNPASGTVKKLINEAQVNISDVQGDVGDVQEIMYKGANGTGTINNPATGTIKKDITVVKSDINSVQGDITTVQGDISTVQSDISDVQTDITTVQGDISTVQGDIGDVQETMYKGANGTGTIDNPANNTIKKDINVAKGEITIVKGDISDVQDDIGTVNRDVNGDLSSQTLDLRAMFNKLLIVSQSNYTPVWIMDLGVREDLQVSRLRNMGYLTDSTNYELWKGSNCSFVKVVRNSSGGRTSSTTNFQKTGMRWVGICFDLINKSVLSCEPYDRVFELKTNKFYVKNGNTWTVANDLSQFLKYTELVDVITDIVYPVGAIYMSMNNTDPSLLFGGTWLPLEDRFLLGAESNLDSTLSGATGGERSHTLTVDEMPSHNHNMTFRGSYPLSGKSNAAIGYDGSSNKYITSYTGGDQPHNNMPPYLVVYMWKRTA